MDGSLMPGRVSHAWTGLSCLVHSCILELKRIDWLLVHNRFLTKLIKTVKTVVFTEVVPVMVVPVTVVPALVVPALVVPVLVVPWVHLPLHYPNEAFALDRRQCPLGSCRLTVLSSAMGSR